MVCRDAVVEDRIAIARVWVAAWQAAYQGSCRRGILLAWTRKRLYRVSNKAFARTHPCSCWK